MLLRVFVSESARHRGQPLYEAIVRAALEADLAGATVLRGVEGFGPHHRLHTTRILRLAEELPMVVEIVDSEAAIEAFLPTLTELLGEGTATLERVRRLTFRPETSDD